MSSVFLNIGGVAFISLDHLLRQLEGSGLTRRGLRSLLAALAVPTVNFGTVTLVNVAMLQVALQSVSRIGRPDFYGPASTPPDGPHTRHLDPAYVKENLRNILAEIVYARKLRGINTKADTTTMIAQAADHLIMMGLRGVSHAGLKGYDLSARRNAVNDDLFGTDQISEEADLEESDDAS